MRGWRNARRVLVLLCAAPAASACELTEVAIADAEDVVVAEFVLIAGAARQSGILHRTRGTGTRLPIDDATVEIRAADGRTLPLRLTDPERCLIEGRQDPLERSACYQSEPVLPIAFVLPRNEYTLRVALSDGRVLTGITHVPAALEMVRPATTVCRIEPDQSFEIVWKRSPTAWVYAAETELRGISDALAARGIAFDREPLRLFGLAVSNTDTTIVFPTEFGVFDRFDPDLTEALAAIQGGLPPGVHGEVVIAAADRNYVNWERGGNFNPSGLVRVPSVFGGGTGVFGSVVPRTFAFTTSAGGPPPC